MENVWGQDLANGRLFSLAMMLSLQEGEKDGLH